MKKDEERLQKIYLDNTKLTKKEIKQLFQSGKANNTDYARKKEIIEETKEYQNDISAPKILFITKDVMTPQGLLRDIETLYFGIPRPSFGNSIQC